MQTSWKSVLGLLPLLILLGGPAWAQTLPPCGERPNFRDPPWVDGRLYCPETVIQTHNAGILPFTALATAPDGTLYATRPLYGQVLAIEDSDGDLLPDRSRVIAEDLVMPNGLAYHDGALYIAGGRFIYRWQAGEVSLLVDDLPVDPGGWVGDLIVGPDDRLYVAVGGGCDFCLPADDRRGAVLSFALDGTDPALIASGLRQAGDLAFLHGDLWVTDSARSGLFHQPDLDELNRVRWGAHFGWPYCVGDNTPDEIDGDFDCATATSPALHFPTGSTPLGLAAYSGAAFPGLQGTLLLVLNGSRFHADLRGYALAVVSFDENQQPADYHVILPERTFAHDRERLSVEVMNYSGSGFWPSRPLDVALSPEGWLYISVSGGEIIALRPA